MKISHTLLPAVIMALACLYTDVSAADSIKPIDLRVGPLLENPISFGDMMPQFSWKLPAGVGVKHQSAYRIVCGHQSKNLPKHPDVWDSGWVQSDQSLFVDYTGKPLASGERVYWSVQFKDQDDRVSAWSEPAFAYGVLLNDSYPGVGFFRSTKAPPPCGNVGIATRWLTALTMRA